jgi:hypothetical protein
VWRACALGALILQGLAVFAAEIVPADRATHGWLLAGLNDVFELKQVLVEQVLPLNAKYVPVLDEPEDTKLRLSCNSGTDDVVGEQLLVLALQVVENPGSNYRGRGVLQLKDVRQTLVRLGEADPRANAKIQDGRLSGVFKRQVDSELELASSFLRPVFLFSNNVAPLDVPLFKQHVASQLALRKFYEIPICFDRGASRLPRRLPSQVRKSDSEDQAEEAQHTKYGADYGSRSCGPLGVKIAVFTLISAALSALALYGVFVFIKHKRGYGLALFFGSLLGTLASVAVFLINVC